MINRSLARRYARALLDLVEKEDSSLVADKLSRFSALLTDSSELQEVLVSPAFRPEERKAVIDKVLSKVKMGDILDRFLRYLVDHRRVRYLEAIAECFLEMVDDQVGRVRVGLDSAVSLDKKIETKIKKSLAESLGKEIVIEKNVDPDLLAGLSVRVRDLVVDGSLKTKLDGLKEKLVKQQN